VRRIRSSGVVIGAALLALAGCGGGSKSASTGTTAAATPPPPSTNQLTQTVTPPTTPTQTATTPPKTQTTTSPASNSGGGQTPIYTQVLFTGSGGDITPATVRVPPYIAVRVELKSGDGGSYGVTVNHHTLRVDSSTETATVQLSGLRPGARYAVEVSGAPERLSVVANAEPGP
jgi:hypothetical protein